jgi:hypothetical protein
MAEQTAQVFSALSKTGLLLKQDKSLPNVVTLVTGQPLSSSWWSHPKGRLIFAVLSELSEHPDVLFTKLLYGKVTLVHRKLWPALVAVAEERAPWQLRALSEAGRELLSEITESKGPIRASGAVVKEIGIRLLAHVEEVHTESGRHAMSLEPWKAWRGRVGIEHVPAAEAGRQQIEEAAAAIGASAPALPWSTTGDKGRR